ncbi:MAG: hypothetical protein ACLS43_05085 [Evtepia gabavorous]
MGTLPGDPHRRPGGEVYAAGTSSGHRPAPREPDLIACPTCGRTKIDLSPLAQAVEGG